MIQEEADLVFNTGDIFRDKGKHYDRDFYPVIEKLARRMPFFPAVGNHDVNWESPGSRDRFYTFFRRDFEYLARQPINEHLVEPSNQKLWYSLIYQDVLFIVLDSNFFI